jgi:small subunit ribosomal protein S16
MPCLDAPPLVEKAVLGGDAACCVAPKSLCSLTLYHNSVILPSTMLMIRFQRIGRVNDPAFRIVVTEKTSGPKAGRYVELVGTYNPKTKAFQADAESIKAWMNKGAQVSPSLKNLLISKGVLEGKKVNVLPKKAPIKKEGEEVAAATPVAQAAPEAPVEEAAAPAEEVPAEEPAATPAA